MPPSRPGPAVKPPLGLRLIAAERLVKGALLSLVSLGILRSLHRDLAAAALQVVQFARISPENRFVVMLLEKLGLVDRSTLVRLGILSALYSSVLLVEGFGLWVGAAWAEYVVVVSFGLFIPEECSVTFHHFTWFRWSILLINTVIFVYVAKVVWDRYQVRKSASAAPSEVVGPQDPGPT
jgi:uncharacterized membrane protein (DUF2068 family)